jgi:hypothetical protein
MSISILFLSVAAKKQALKRLDVSRFHATGLCRQPAVSKAFGFNYTLGRGTGKSVHIPN